MVIAISFVLVFHGDGNAHVSGNGNSTAVGNDNMITYSTVRVVAAVLVTVTGAKVIVIATVSRNRSSITNASASNDGNLSHFL